MSATIHLYNNFKELQKCPIVGANAMFQEENVLKWYCIVVGPEGSPYSGVPVRFTLEFDNNYPNTPPKAFFDTFFAYSGGAQMRDEKGRIGVCLDIFGNFGMVHTEWKDNVGSGWSPSYTVSTILLTMQCLLSDRDMISLRTEDIKRTLESSRDYRCSVTGHNGASRDQWVPKVFLSNEEINSYKAENGIVTELPAKYDPLVDNYVCYITKETAAAGALLGFGIHVENARIGSLSSPCEYLSKPAFENGTRQSTLKKPFEYWLPILIHSGDWLSTVKPRFLAAVATISKTLSFGNVEHQNVVKVCSSLMNTLVVEIMNARNNVTANDKFINGYFSIYRLLKQFVADEILCKEYIDSQLEAFCQSVSNRNKSKVPNLGELLIFLTVSERFTWKDIKEFFLEESDARNVFWYTVGNHHNPPKFPALLNPTVRGSRPTQVFSATPVSRNLIMYQVEFSKLAASLSLEFLDSNCGLAPTEMRDKLKNIYGSIDSVADWNGYFQWLEMIPVPTDSERCDQLINAVRLSNTQGYTGASAAAAPSKKPPRKY
jgi:ubiquitin-conjugating enzyme E2 A